MMSDYCGKENYTSVAGDRKGCAGGKAEGRIAQKNGPFRIEWPIVEVPTTLNLTAWREDRVPAACIVLSRCAVLLLWCAVLLLLRHRLGRSLLLLGEAPTCGV